MANILVVEDDVDLRGLYKAFLSFRGFFATTCGSKEEFINSIEQQHPDLIILDVNLSGADGREICREIKGNPKTEKIPVILISANSELLKTYKEYCADIALAKPFNIDDLITAINKLLYN